MADTEDLKSSAFVAWGFESPLRHQFLNRVRSQGGGVGRRAGLRSQCPCDVQVRDLSLAPCRSGGMGDVGASKAPVRKGVWVRIPPPAPITIEELL